MTQSDPERAERKSDPEILGSNHRGMRNHNERLVLSILRRKGPLSKAEIARMTSLSAQTVSVIMRGLEADGYLEKVAKIRGRVGQPSVPLRLDPNGAFFIGLKVGRRSAELVLVDFVGEILIRRSQTYRYPTPEETIGFVRSAVADIDNDLTSDQFGRIAGLGIASPYYLWEWASIIGVEDHEMAVWKDFDLRSEIEMLYEFPVYVGNDASCACGAELVFGRVPTPQDFLYIYIGYFIGGGVVLNGNLYTGSSGNAGAIGPFPAMGAQFPRRQLVDVASLIGLERRLHEANRRAQEIWEKPAAWIVDDEIVSDWLDEAAPAIAHTVLAAISVIDFSTIVIDGSLPPELRARIVARVNKCFHELNLSGLSEPRILPGTIGADARPLGAASLPLLRRFALDT